MIDTKNLMPIVYVAGNYSNGGKASHYEMRINRDVLRYYASIFIRNGWAVICPIENDLWAADLGLIDYDQCLNKDFALINRSDAIFFCPGWESSKGALLEHKFVQEKAKHLFVMYHNTGHIPEFLDIKRFQEYNKYRMEIK